MKLKIIIAALLISGISFIVCPAADTVIPYGSSKRADSVKTQGIPVSVPSNPVLGSISYESEVNRLEKVFGSRAAMDKIMSDVGKYGYQLDLNSESDILRFYGLVSRVVGHIGHVNLKVHYFRNKLNRAPSCLSEFIRLNSCLRPDKRWQLIPVGNSLYHMQGKGGEYNLKFVSPEGYLECVYNKDGVLLTEENDPVNMGTFNFAAGIPEKGSHHRFDVEPYLKWGNSPKSPQRGTAAIKKASEEAHKRYMEHSADVNAYRSTILGMYAAVSPKALKSDLSRTPPGIFQQYCP